MSWDQVQSQIVNLLFKIKRLQILVVSKLSCESSNNMFQVRYLGMISYNDCLARDCGWPDYENDSWCYLRYYLAWLVVCGTVRVVRKFRVRSS